MSVADPSTVPTLARARWHVALVLTATMLLAYFGFVGLVAFDKPLLGTIVTEGLSVGILAGAGVITFAWLLTGVYVAWANHRYDALVASHQP